MSLDEQDKTWIRQALAEALARTAGAGPGYGSALRDRDGTLARGQAMVAVRRPSTAAFERYREDYELHPCARGRYSVEAVRRALAREAAGKISAAGRKRRQVNVAKRREQRATFQPAA